jgi:signal transduction histidine kinase
MRINYIRRLLEHDRSAAQEELLKVEEMARRTTQEIRHMLFTLRPLVLESEGLRAALQAMADKVVETFGQPVSITVDEGLIGDLEINKQTVIFFIAEEAVNNARKHAQAEQIWVRLRRAYEDPELAVLEIEDNGVGFDPAGVLENYEQRGSLGMINLQERSSLVNGLLQIDSAPGKGARVLVFIPLSEAASDRLRHG